MTDRPPVKISFVGCGTHSTNNLYPALAYADCVLDSTCDLDLRLASRNARLHGAAAAYTEVERMLDERRPDAVMVVGPATLHYQVAKLALARGLPVFVEKPTAPSLEMTIELTRLARANGTFIMTGFMKRWGMTYAKARALIADGFVPAAGFFKYGHWLTTDLYGMLHGMSVHPIDLALSFFGMPTSISSMRSVSPRGGISLAVSMRSASGAVVQLMLDSSQPRIQERVEISGAMGGENALIVVDNVDQLELHRQANHGVDVLCEHLHQITPRIELGDIQRWRPDNAIPNMGQTRLFFQGFAGEVREFAAAVAQKRDPYPSPEAAIDTMRVVDALMRKPDGVTEFAAAAVAEPALAATAR